MVSLDDIVLVSEEDFASTYSSRYHLKTAVKDLASAGITFPIRYSSPFFRQLSALAVLVYFKGTVSIIEREEDGEELAPTYAAFLYPNNKLDIGFVNRKLFPYFSVSQANKTVAVGASEKTYLHRPLSRILHCMEIPTNAEHLEAARLPLFMTELAKMYPELGVKDDRVLAYRLLLDMCEDFFNVKTTFNHNFYWEFFLPIKKDLSTARRFRSDIVWFFKQVLPEINFKRLGEPTPRMNSDGDKILYYKSILALREDSTKALLSNYSGVLDLESVVKLNPKVQEFYVTARHAKAA